MANQVMANFFFFLKLGGNRHKYEANEFWQWQFEDDARSLMKLFLDIRSNFRNPYTKLLFWENCIFNKGYTNFMQNVCMYAEGGVEDPIK